MRLLLVALCTAALLAGCALRPRYADFVNEKTPGKELTFVVIDADTKKPVPGAKIEVSELKNRINVTTGPDGTFKLPVDKKYVSENPVFVVALPAGVTHYELRVAPAPQPLPVPPQPLPLPVPPPTPVEPSSPGAESGLQGAVDAGI